MREVEELEKCDAGRGQRLRMSAAKRYVFVLDMCVWECVFACQWGVDVCGRLVTYRAVLHSCRSQDIHKANPDHKKSSHRDTPSARYVLRSDFIGPVLSFVSSPHVPPLLSYSLWGLLWLPSSEG